MYYYIISTIIVQRHERITHPHAKYTAEKGTGMDVIGGVRCETMLEGGR